MSLRDALILNGNGGADISRDFELDTGLVSNNLFADVFTARAVEGPAPFPAFTTEPEKTVIPLSADVATIEAKTATVATEPSKSIGDYLGGIFNNVLDSLKTTGQAALEGAVEGATAASSGAAAGAQVGAQTTRIGTTTLLFGAVVLILLLRK